VASREIWDTNVFRDLGAGDLGLDDLHRSGAAVFYSPVTPLELASKYTEGSFEHRRAAARAILDSGAELLPDPEFCLAQAFRLHPSEDQFDWRQGVVAMAQSTTLEELQRGVTDYVARVRRRVNIGLARSYCDGIEQDFVRDMLNLQRNDIPGFSEWYDAAQRRGNMPRLGGKARDVFLAGTRDPMFTGELMFACLRRASFKAAEPPPWPPNEEWVRRLVEASYRLEFYCAVYTGYLVQLLTGGLLPRANDWFDLEILMYSESDDVIIVTSDAKWRLIAEAAGMPQRVIVP
jgi:hypothetical protein